MSIIWMNLIITALIYPNYEYAPLWQCQEMYGHWTMGQWEALRVTLDNEHRTLSKLFCTMYISVHSAFSSALPLIRNTSDRLIVPTCHIYVMEWVWSWWYTRVTVESATERALDTQRGLLSSSPASRICHIFILTSLSSSLGWRIIISKQKMLEYRPMMH